MKTAKDKSSKLADQKAKVLIIDDDRYMCDIMSRNLIKGGFEAIAVVSGEEGINKAKEGGVQLVLLDLVLPGTDGFEVLRRLKEDSSTAFIPVIILSSLDQREDIDRGLKLGAADYLVKVRFTSEEVIEKAKSVIQKSHT